MRPKSGAGVCGLFVVTPHGPTSCPSPAEYLLRTNLPAPSYL
jgi:hypothetical protein